MNSRDGNKMKENKRKRNLELKNSLSAKGSLNGGRRWCINHLLFNWGTIRTSENNSLPSEYTSNNHMPLIRQKPLNISLPAWCEELIKIHHIVSKCTTGIRFKTNAASLLAFHNARTPQRCGLTQARRLLIGIIGRCRTGWRNNHLRSFFLAKQRYLFPPSPSNRQFLIARRITLLFPNAKTPFLTGWPQGRN